MEDFENADAPLLGNRKDDNDKYLEGQIQKDLREGFITKVFGIIAYQIFLLFLVVLFAFLNKAFRQLLLTSSLLYWITLITALLCLIIPIFKPSLYQKVPTNYIILTIFTLSYSWWIALYTIFFTPSSVLLAVFLTLITVLLITIYAFRSKKDYTVYGGVLFTALNLLLICGILLIFFKIELLYVIEIYGGLLLFCAYLLYDVQLLVGDKSRKFGEDDYILAAINIYLDIIGIFIRILAIVGNKNN